MAPANTLTFILVTSILVLYERAATARDESPGYHGYERDALLRIKEAFNNSFLNKNWIGIMCYLNDPSYWYGIQCAEGRVTGITLENMDLRGGFQVEVLLNLTQLVTLSLKNNSIHGKMIGFTYNNKLRNIDLSGNSFVGEIPSSLLYLNSLQSLHLGGRGTHDRVPFRWSSRLNVACAVARALHHLHTNTRSSATAPHGNLKSTNVLLNDDPSNVYVSDYGLTSLIALPVAAQRMAAYKSPEYLSNKQISKKSDVWSYGCLLLELLTGKIPSYAAPQGTNGVDLCAWVHRAVREEWTAEIFDPEIAVQRGANKGMLKLMRISMRCCEKAPEKRPEIGEVVAEVEEICSRTDASEEEGDFQYSSFDSSLTDDSYSSVMSGVGGGDDRR